MINWNDIDTVLLDMDGTLLDLHYDNHFWMTHLPKRYAEIHAISIHESTQQLHDHIHSIKGTLNWYCLDYWADTLNIDILALKRETQHKIVERPYTLAFLAFLQSEGKNTHLVTNSHRDGIDIKFEVTQIGGYFDRIISSHDYKQPKEVDAFWQHLHQDLSLNKERTLFIDDNLHVLNAASKFGIKHLIGIHQPDSRQERTLTEMPAIYDFNEIMPNG